MCWRGGRLRSTCCPRARPNRCTLADSLGGVGLFTTLAYSDGRCNGMKTADLKSKGLDLPDPPATLQVREMERILDFLQVKVIGQGPMTRAKCIEFWGSDVSACAEFPK